MIDKTDLIHQLKMGTTGESVFFYNTDGYLVMIASQKDILGNLFEEEGNHLVVGISKRHNSIQTIKKAYIEANETFKHRIISSKSVQRYDEVEKRNKKFTIDLQKIHSIINMINTGRKGEIFQNIDELFSQKLRDETHVDYFIEMSRQLTSKIIEMDNCIQIHDLYWYSTIDEYISALKESILIVDQQANGKENNSSYAAIKKAEEYINQNFREDINLAISSNEVNLNYTYFCEVFKIHTGETFVSYLRKIRVKKAMELLLQHPEYKIYEIATLVGYEDSKQFTKIFGKIAGISPIEYKNKNYKYKFTERE